MIGTCKASSIHGQVSFIADSYAHVSNDDIVRSETSKRVPPNAYSAARCRLTGDGDVWIMDHQFALELNGTSDSKDDHARALGFDGCSKRTRSDIIQVGNL